MYSDAEVMDFIRQYQPKIRKTIKKWQKGWLRNFDAGDIEQEIHLAILEFAKLQGERGGELFWPTETVKGHLCRMALMSKALTGIRYTDKGGMQKWDKIPIWNISLEDLDGTCLDVASVMSLEERIPEIDFELAVERLPPNERQMISLLQDGYTRDSIANQLHITKYRQRQIEKKLMKDMGIDMKAAS